MNKSDNQHFCERLLCLDSKHLTELYFIAIYVRFLEETLTVVYTYLCCVLVDFCSLNFCKWFSELFIKKKNDNIMGPEKSGVSRSVLTIETKQER